MKNIIFRKPTVKDAFSLWMLVKDNKPLDENSKYLYLLLCHEFSETCVVAEHDSKIIGFISAFISPLKPDTLFVWQAAVDEKFRNKGMAKNLIANAFLQSGPSTKYVEATVTPSNKASLKFLQNFADTFNANFSKKPLFESALLGNDHEQEDLVRIGPIIKRMQEVSV